MSEDDVIGAFSEEQAEMLTGISLNQLRAWDRRGFFKPEYGSGVPGEAYGRVYSFHDLVALRVLNELRNKHKITLAHLRKVSDELGGLSNDKWSKHIICVLGRNVVIYSGDKKIEPVSKQYVADIPLKVVISSTKQAIRALNQRGSDMIGQIVRSKFVESFEPVIAGTRVRVAAIKSYYRAGFDTARIISEFPTLTPADVVAALAYEQEVAVTA